MIVTAEHLIEKLDAKYSAMVQNICILDKTCLQKKTLQHITKVSIIKLRQN